jgi:hypothetical protein
MMKIEKVERCGSFVLKFFFQDGKITLIDFEPFLTHSHNAQICKYLQEEMFANFQLRDGEISWNNGDLSFHPYSLYVGNLYEKELEGKLIETFQTTQPALR